MSLCRNWAVDKIIGSVMVLWCHSETLSLSDFFLNLRSLYCKSVINVLSICCYIRSQVFIDSCKTSISQKQGFHLSIEIIYYCENCVQQQISRFLCGLPNIVCWQFTLFFRKLTNWTQMVHKNQRQIITHCSWPGQYFHILSSLDMSQKHADQISLCNKRK